ncbi:uncharacterized protein LOC117125251 [Anneissia japonica]|uniref:uncharacterized protein LOC117125251 n=1 Tax=Anneissia japonica TaxID=1529436 RepID=UPI001425824A|nr:uncharacterized protein LOC117125251 [Anneissia japonica]
MEVLAIFISSVLISHLVLDLAAVGGVESLSALQACNGCALSFGSPQGYRPKVVPTYRYTTRPIGPEYRSPKQHNRAISDSGTQIKALKKPHETNLPLVYRHAHVIDEELPTMVRMFLSDANFPAFVGQVEKELNAIMQ